MRQYQMYELSLHGSKLAGNQVDIPLEAVFSSAGRSVTVSGFYAGDGIYKVRFLPQQAGRYTWTVHTPLPLDGPLTGEAECAPAAGSHGLVKAEGLHFRYEDGTRYAPFGTTVYALVHQEEALVDRTIEALRHAPFNKVRMCVFPKHYDFNHNEPEVFPFEKTDGRFDVSRPCFAFWDMLENRIQELDQLEIQADVILFHPYDHWGFASLTKEECFIYLDHLTRRLAAFPNVWWSMANEYDLMDRFEPERWQELAGFVRSHDPYGHLLSNHHCVTMWDFSDPSTTHCCIQGSAFHQIPELQKTYHKPVVFDEVGYEGDIPYNWGNLSAFELVDRFWRSCALGGYCTHGETFWNEDELLWWAKGGELRGKSAPRIAFLRSVLEGLPGPITPLPSRWDREKLLAAIADPEQAAAIPTVVKCIAQMPDAQFAAFAAGEQEFAGSFGDIASLHYLSRRCSAWIDLSLPEGKHYDVEVIDVWEMTHTKVLEDVSGQIKVPLPGKEGIAVLAVAKPGSYMWENDVQRIEMKYDKTRVGEILFYGASNFALWDHLDQDFAEYKVQNHAFGGSMDTDLVAFADRLLFPYAPQIIVFQTGSNDYVLLDGNDAEKIERCIAYKRAMFDRFHKQLPTSHFVVMSGILLPGRQQFIPMTLEINRRIKELCDNRPYMHFVDATPLFYSDEKTHPEIFQDSLHLNRMGKLLWRDRYIKPCLDRLIAENGWSYLLRSSNQEGLI